MPQARFQAVFEISRALQFEGLCAFEERALFILILVYYFVIYITLETTTTYLKLLLHT